MISQQHTLGFRCGDEANVLLCIINALALQIINYVHLTCSYISKCAKIVPSTIFVLQVGLVMSLKNTTAFSLSDHFNLSQEWRGIVDLVQTNYHGEHMILKSIRCDRAVNYQ